MNSQLQQLDKLIAAQEATTKKAKVFRRQLVRRDKQTKKPKATMRSECDCSTEEAAALAAMQVAATEQTEADVALMAAISADGVWQNCLQNCM